MPIEEINPYVHNIAQVTAMRVRKVASPMIADILSLFPEGSVVEKDHNAIEPPKIIDDGIQRSKFIGPAFKLGGNMVEMYDLPDREIAKMNTHIVNTELAKN